MPSKEQVDADPAARAGDPTDAPAGAEHAASPPGENPTSRQSVHDFIAGRVAADAQMRMAGAARAAAQHADQGDS